MGRDGEPEIKCICGNTGQYQCIPAHNSSARALCLIPLGHLLNLTPPYEFPRPFSHSILLRINAPPDRAHCIIAHQQVVTALPSSHGLLWKTPVSLGSTSLPWVGLLGGAAAESHQWWAAIPGRTVPLKEGQRVGSAVRGSWRRQPMPSSLLVRLERAHPRARALFPGGLKPFLGGFHRGNNHRGHL